MLTRPSEQNQRTHSHHSNLQIRLDLLNSSSLQKDIFFVSMLSRFVEGLLNHRARPTNGSDRSSFLTRTLFVIFFRPQCSKLGQSGRSATDYGCPLWVEGGHSQTISAGAKWDVRTKLQLKILAYLTQEFPDLRSGNIRRNRGVFVV